MKIKNVSTDDIPKWVMLSKEYDDYVREVTSDITEWYEGSDTSISFENYMKSKIDKGEASMAVGENDECYGIIAISQRNNNITFFGVSHGYDIPTIGGFLLEYALSKLDLNRSIKINELKSDTGIFKTIYEILGKFGFVYLCDTLENGVVVNCMERKPM